MQVLEFLRCLRSQKGTEGRLTRFRKVLAAAQHVPLYQTCLRRANLDSKRAINSLRRVEDALQHFETIDLKDVADPNAAFGNSRQFPSAPQRFFNPLKQASKVAVLRKGFQEIAGLRTFDDGAFVVSFRQSCAAAVGNERS